MPFSSVSSSLPAWPTKGTPFLSSWKPGASPTNSRSAVGSPEPKTTCVRVAASGQRVQVLVASSYSSSSSLTTVSLRRGQDDQPQPQPPPQQPPPLSFGCEETPATAKLESCLSTFPAPQSGQQTACSGFRTSSSKCDSHSMHAYS